MVKECRNCGHWWASGDDDSRGPRRECTKAVFDVDGPADDVPMVVYDGEGYGEGYPAGLETLPTHCCNEYTEKTDG